MDQRRQVAVLDMGKTNVKLSAVTRDGRVLETLAIENAVRPGPPWRHNDLAGISDWAFSSLAALCHRHDIGHVIAAGYGSGGVLVTDDPDGPGGGAALPMIDYEQALPPGLAADYADLAGSFYDRGSAIMQAATHQARQMLWMARQCPAEFSSARWYLGTPQYWAWRLSGRPVAEESLLGAQSHLWNVVDKRFAPIVDSQGWRRLMPGFTRAWDDVGPVRPELARRFGLPPDLRVHGGVHDSSANFYRYQAAGLVDFAVVSTGTWIVALADHVPLVQLDEARNMTLNCDVAGQPTGGALVMGGREFSHVAGAQASGALSDAAVIERLMARGSFAVPAFGADSGQFPGSAGRGRFAGPPPEDAEERLALAVLYMALLTAHCADLVAAKRRIVLDGTYLRDANYIALVAALRGGAETLYNPESYGVAAGAALLCSHLERNSPVALQLKSPQAFVSSSLAGYAAHWLSLSHQQSQGH